MSQTIVVKSEPTASTGREQLPLSEERFLALGHGLFHGSSEQRLFALVDLERALLESPNKALLKRPEIFDWIRALYHDSDLPSDEVHIELSLRENETLSAPCSFDLFVRRTCIQLLGDLEDPRALKMLVEIASLPERKGGLLEERLLAVMTLTGAGFVPNHDAPLDSIRLKSDRIDDALNLLATLLKLNFSGVPVPYGPAVRGLVRAIDSFQRDAQHEERFTMLLSRASSDKRLDGAARNYTQTVLARLQGNQSLPAGDSSA